MSKQTAGSLVLDNIEKSSIGMGKVSPLEIQQASEKEYLDNLVWSVNHARKEVDCSSIDGHDSCKDRKPISGNFFISALLKKEKILENVLRNYFVPTVTCPTPAYDQTVYRYNDKKGDIEFLWVIPDHETCMIFLENKDKIVPKEQALLQFIIDFHDGKLVQICKRLNGETEFAGGALKGK